MIKHNGTEKDFSKAADLPLLGLGTTHLFEVASYPQPRIVFKVRVVFDGYEVTRSAFKPEPNPDIEKTVTDYGLVQTRDGLWAVLTGPGPCDDCGSITFPGMFNGRVRCIDCRMKNR